MRHESRFPLVALFFFGVTALTASAQIPLSSTCGGGAPVSITSGVVKAVVPGKVKPAVRVTNVGTKPISAIFLRWRYVDKDNKAVDAIESVDYAVSDSLMQPKDSLIMEGDDVVSSATIPGVFPVRRIEVSCMTILFRGDGIWGDLTLPGIQEVRDARRVIKMERGRLLDAYKKQGLDGLLQELNRPVVN